MDELNGWAAAMMGMKRSEVIEVVPVDDAHAVRTHDGQWTLVRDDGRLRPITAPLVNPEEAEAAMLRGFRGEPEPEEPATPAKPAPKRRGRS